MSDAGEQVEYATFGPGPMHLACACRRPAGWVRPELPPDEPRFDDPTYVQALGILMAPYGAVLFTISVRPAFNDGTVHDWTQFLCKSNQLEIGPARVTSVNGMPALAADASQPSEMGPMHVRAVFLENDKRLFLLNAMAPEQVWPSVEQVFEQLFASFRLAQVGPATAALGVEAPPAAVAAETAPPPAQAESEAYDEDEDDEIVTEDPRTVANAPPADTGRPTRPADVALADDASSLDEEHEMNRRLRDNGVGLVPRVVMVSERERFASVAAGAIGGTMRVPLGWHVIDDGRRTLVFDAGGKMQLSLNLRHATPSDHASLRAAIRNELCASSPEAESLELEMGGMLCLAVRNLVLEGERLQQGYVIRESNRADMALVCRATAADDADFTFAMNTAEVLLTTYLPPAPEPKPDGPPWWHRALELERQDKFDEAEALLQKSIDHLGCYSQIAYLYELRAARLSAAGAEPGARDAAKRARDWLYQYASAATSGGEGAALSLERDQRVAGLAHLLD